MLFIFGLQHYKILLPKPPDNVILTGAGFEF